MFMKSDKSICYKHRNQQCKKREVNITKKIPLNIATVTIGVKFGG